MKQIFDPDVRYICDRRACVNCYPECKHTDDIRHAANFEIIGGDMWEKETELATLEQASDDDGRLLHVLSSVAKARELWDS